jgi:lipopolysaccharide transport system permease protein
MFECLNIWPYRHLILHKAWADFRADSERNYLGVLWWILDPIINITIYFVVFGGIFGRGGPDNPDYIPFLTIGIIGWIWFNTAVTSASRSILANVGFVRQVPFKKVVFPCSQIMICSYQFGFSLLVLFSVLFLFKVPPSPFWLLLPVVLAVEFLLITAFAFVLGAFVPFVPDLGNLVAYTLRLAFFLSCVMYPIEAVAEKSPTIAEWLYFNPMVHVLNSLRDVLMYARFPNWQVLGALALLSCLGIYLGAWFMHRFNEIYAKRIVA